MTKNGPTDELAVLRVVKDALARLGPEERKRIFTYLSALYDLDVSAHPSPFRTHRDTVNIQSRDRDMTFADRLTLSPKDFLQEKRPQKVTERIACLAYYLSHYRDTPHFRAIDISKLNTEAAQLKLTNPSFAIKNASDAGLLASAGQGAMQLSAIGERFVDALPNRDAAMAVLRESRSSRSWSKKRNSKKKARGTTR
jgi:hypothetical protein